LINIPNDNQEATNYTINLETANDLFILTTKIGTPAQSFNLILDTQRTLSMISGKDCQTCKSNIFDETQSSTYKTISKNVTIEFLRDNLTGSIGSDVFSINDLDVSNDLFSIASIASGRDFNADGLLGVGPSKNIEDNLIYKLKANKVIDKAVFGILLNQEQPIMSLGHYDENIMNQTTPVYTSIKYSDDVNFTKWYFDAANITLNNKTINATQKFTINTSSSIVFMPKAFFDKYRKDFFNKSSICEYAIDNLFHCKCDNDYNALFPNITINLGNNQIIYFEPDDYIYLETSESDLSKNCLLTFSLNYNNDYWILGNNFITNYYTMFDLENNKLGFADVRNLTFGSISSTLLFCGIILLSSVIFFILLYVIYRKIMNRRNSYQRMQN
jgi:hypothetical protein